MEHVPTPLLDRLRPRVLEALRVRGWSCSPSQYERCFRVRITRDKMAALLEFHENDTSVTYSTTGHGHTALADLRIEKVLS